MEVWRCRGVEVLGRLTSTETGGQGQGGGGIVCMLTVAMALFLSIVHRMHSYKGRFVGQREGEVMRGVDEQEGGCVLCGVFVGGSYFEGMKASVDLCCLFTPGSVWWRKGGGALTHFSIVFFFCA